MTNKEIDYLVEVLKHRFPDMHNSFDKQPPQLTRRTVLDGILYNPSSFVPPSDEQIDDYKTTVYPSWIIKCRKYFTELHNNLQSNLEWPNLAFDVSNDSNNTGHNALVRDSSPTETSKYNRLNMYQNLTTMKTGRMN